MYTNNSFYPGSSDVVEQVLCHTGTLLPFWQQREKASPCAGFLYLWCFRGLARQSTLAGVYGYFLTQSPKDVHIWYSWVFYALENGLSDYTSVVTKCFLLFWIQVWQCSFLQILMYFPKTKEMYVIGISIIQKMGFLWTSSLSQDKVLKT